MSYCRFGSDSDVYVIPTKEGIECCGCLLSENRYFFTVKSPQEMLQHLTEHFHKGHMVPTYALERLQSEIK